MPVFKAYAKINLGLIVVRKRADGYHDIETVFHRIGLADEITLQSSDRVVVTSDNPEAPSGAANICYEAVEMLRRHADAGRGVVVQINKGIPVGAGLGGGSSDAAMILKELPGLWGVRVEEHTLRSLALGLGSDVPFFLGAGSAYASGRGEILEYFDLDIPYYILLCYPNIHIATPWAYGQVTPSLPPIGHDLRRMLHDGMRDPVLLTDHLRNDFEGPVFREFPEVAGVKEYMLRTGALFASLSGSGSAVYGFFRTEEDTRSATEEFRARGYVLHVTPPHFRPGR